MKKEFQRETLILQLKFVMLFEALLHILFCLFVINMYCFIIYYIFILSNLTQFEINTFLSTKLNFIDIYIQNNINNIVYEVINSFLVWTFSSVKEIPNLLDHR